MKVLVTGSKGQLGFDVIKELEKRKHIVIGVDIEDMDITDSYMTEKVISESKAEAVIHCAAYTAVDAAEDNEEICRNINVAGTQNIADVCKKLDIKMVYISTDYVFDGMGEEPWKPEDDRNPINMYGQTKYEGELAVENTLEKYYIVRISWVFGINGKNFVKTMINLGKERERITVVNDQIGSPTYTKDLAVLLADMVQTDKYGIYHATNEGICSWYDFAHEIFRQTGIEVELLPVTSEEYPSRAKRPFNSRMSKDKLEKNGFARLPLWKNGLARYIEELENNDSDR